MRHVGREWIDAEVGIRERAADEAKIEVLAGPRMEAYVYSNMLVNGTFRVNLEG